MTPSSETIGKIISLEWEMFTAVNEGQTRASCQEDPKTFEGMRNAQYTQWNQKTAESYLADVETARAAGRNLIAEKYIHMMKTTDPGAYKALIPEIPAPTADAAGLAQEITDLLIEQTRLLYENYPHISGAGRPLYTEFDSAGTSVETYQRCELLTYSEKTLRALLEHATELAKNEESLARNILEATVRHYGYESLEKAETATAARIERKNAQGIPGFCAGDGCAL